MPHTFRRHPVRSFALAAVLACAALLSGSGAQAETTRTVYGARLKLSDVMPQAPEDVAVLDLGPAPPPAVSRVIGRDELVRRLLVAGIDPNTLKLPKSVRVTSASKRFSPAEFKQFALQPVTNSLPRGVRLIDVSTRSALLPSRATLGTVRLSQLPKREGVLRTSAIADVMLDGEVTSRLSLSLLVEVDAAAFAPDLERGALVELIVQMKSAQVTATAEALEAVRIGEVARFRVARTQKTLRARLESRNLARVVE
jgi:flagella basal body P-ring formation protein FlgA